MIDELSVHEKVRPLISFFIPSLDGGGAERVTVTLINAIVEKGYSVELLMPSANGVYLNDIKKEVKVISLGKPNTLSCIVPLAKYMKNSRAVALLSVLNHANVIAILAKLFSRSKIKLVVAEHNNLVRAVRHDKSFRTKIITNLMKVLYPRANNVIAVSEGVAKSLAEVIGYPEEKIDVIYNPVVTDRVLELCKKTIEHNFFSLKGDKIVAVGRLTAQKDFKNLLKAIAFVQETRNIQLVILGEGELRSELENLRDKLGLNEIVHMPGFVDNPYAWMSAADLFVLSSAWEGLPTVLIEAMAAGTKVVSTDCPSGPCEILQEGKWGELVPVAQPMELAEAILRTLAEPEGKNVTERALVFNVENSVKQYLKLFGCA